jgi:hypothetical protein
VVSAKRFVAAPLSLAPIAIAACSIVAGLGPERGPLPAADAEAADAAAEDGLSSGGTGAVIGGCRIFPPDNPWNRDISGDPVDTDAMTNIMPNMVPTMGLHPDWGDTINMYGIPFNVGQDAPVQVTFTGPNAAESDLVPCPAGAPGSCYPIPPSPKIEADKDAHLLVLDTTNAPDDCTLYELFEAAPSGGGFTAANGAVFHLGSNALRPDGWVSSDRGGLPVLPGLVRFEETSLGEIRHALRLTMHDTFLGYIHPATHAVGTATAGLPPFGLRLRLKASFDLGPFSGLSLVILRAMQKYGLILADMGTSWYITGDSNDGWTPAMDDLVAQFAKVHGSDFEIVQSGPVITTGL